MKLCMNFGIWDIRRRWTADAEADPRISLSSKSSLCFLASNDVFSKPNLEMILVLAAVIRRRRGQLHLCMAENWCPV